MIAASNILHMLSFLWSHVDLDKFHSVHAIEEGSPKELLARLLCEATESTFRSGLIQSYEPTSAVTTRPRGRVDFHRQAQVSSRRFGAVACRYFSLSFDCDENRIIKRAARTLASDTSVTDETAARLHWIVSMMAPVGDAFSRSGLGILRRRRIRNPSQELAVFIAILATESTGMDLGGGDIDMFAWPTTATGLGLLFEDFVRAYWTRQCPPGVAISRHRYRFGFAPRSSESLRNLLPDMKSDIEVSGLDYRSIVEVKLADPLPRTGRHGDPNRRRLSRSHLSQLLAYLTARDQRASEETVRGGLLYAQADSRVRARFELEGFDVWIATVDLQAPWEHVLSELRTVLSACIDPAAIGGSSGLVDLQPRLRGSRFAANA
jgi:5-methylcytosine-specific restriction enzyme subunit McrC